MAPRYQRVGQPATTTGGGGGIFDAIARRPSRLIPIALAFFLIITFTSWLGFTDTGTETAQQWATSAKAAGQKAGSWIGSKVPAGAGNAGAAAVHPGTSSHANGSYTSYMTEHGEISPADALYNFSPGEAPATYEDMVKWGEKDEHGNIYPPAYIPASANKAPRVKAGFITLVRNSELEELQKSMLEVEHRFNRKYNYPWIFLNDADFDDNFKKGVRKMTRAEIRFGKVGKEHWGYPDFIDQKKAADTRERMKNIIYGWSESYRHMCRFQSGFFFKHPQTLDLDYYWRVEPGIKLYCDIDYDPFLFMQMNNKSYGFTMALHEYRETVATLWDTTQKFAQKYPQYVAKDSGLHFLTDNPEKGVGGTDWNLCHFWSNFEIGDLRFWRGEAYQKYFEWLDQSGGFFYERWGDAPVHSVAAMLFLDRSRVHHFNDIGYFHVPWDHCPSNRKKFHENGKCNCDPDKTFDTEGYSCLKEWYRTAKLPWPPTADS